MPISCIVGMLVLYIASNNVLGQQNLTNRFCGGLFTGSIIF